MTRLALAIGLIAFGALPAAAQSGLNPVVQNLRTQGYTNIEVEREGGRIKIEARRGTVERELVYDAGTGRLLSDETDFRDGSRGLGAVFAGISRPGRDSDDDRNDDDRGGDDRGDDNDDDGDDNDDDDDDDDDGGNDSDDGDDD